MIQPYVHRSRATPASLFIIRLSLVFAVLSFGVITWFLHSQRTEPFPTDTATITWIVLGAWSLITIAIVFWSRRYRQAARDQRVTLAIIGWAMGEAAAMLGGVHYFVTGSPQRYGYGVLIFVLTLLLFPIPRGDEEGPRLVR